MEVVVISVSLKKPLRIGESWIWGEVFADFWVSNGLNQPVGPTQMYLLDYSPCPRQMPLDLQAEPQADQVPADMFLQLLPLLPIVAGFLGEFW